MLKSHNEKVPIDRREPEVTEFAIEQGEQHRKALHLLVIAIVIVALLGFIALT